MPSSLASAPSCQATVSTQARAPIVWLLMGTRVGDNNQLLALAEALGYPFEAKEIAFNQLRRIPWLRHGLTAVARRSRPLIAPPWPDLVIGCGYGSVAVARYIRHRGGGRTKLVHIGNPRTRLDDFDLQITTPQYARDAAGNLLELPFPIGNPAQAATPDAAERKWLRHHPHPRRLVAVGGPARHWELDHRALRRAIVALQRKSPAGSIIVAVSPRTRPKTRRLLERLVAGRADAVVETFPRFAVLLGDCDEILVTADSVSMLSEAILSGPPVGMIPIRRSLRGLISHILWENPTGRATLPNFRNFWHLLRRRRMVGTIELPVASQVCDTVERAAEAVRSLLPPGDQVAEEEAERAASHLGPSRGTRRRQRSGARARGTPGTAVRGKAARL
jgi:mitochondrial fission protein ELM1